MSELTPKERMDALDKNTWYWIQTSEYLEPIPFYYNNDSQWKLSFNGCTTFVNSAKMRGIFGKDCVLREVDVIKDRVFERESTAQLLPRVSISDDKRVIIFMANDFITMVDYIAVPEDLGEFYIKYCE